MLTPRQIEYLLAIIKMVSESENKAGEIRIEIINGHVRKITPAITLYFPKPEDEQKTGA